MKIGKEIKAGAITVLAITAFVWGFNFLKGTNVLSANYELFAEYSHIEGLVKSNPVMIHGMKVGLVEQISFKSDGSGDILIKMLITNTFPIPNNTIAKIYSTDIMGAKGIDLILGDGTALVKSGDTLPSDIEASLKDAVNAQVAPLKRKAEGMLSSIDSALVQFRAVFNQETGRDLQASLKNMSITMKSLSSVSRNADTLLDSQRETLANILKNSEAITKNFSNNNKVITHILNNVSTVSDSLAKLDLPMTMKRMDSTLLSLNTILQQVEAGRGSVGQLLYNDSLYIELEKSSREMNLLLEDIRKNPKRYVKFSLF